MVYIAVAVLAFGPLAPVRAAGAVQYAHDTTQDRSAIAALEQQWLEARDGATLERILAADFVHPVPSGVFLTKAEHIAWVVAHPRPASTEVSFERLQVRLYGSVALANGIVVARAAGRPPQRTIFTDVFVRRGGRWQAINAQENIVVAP